MTTAQKIIKYAAIAFAVFLTVGIVGSILGTIGVLGGIFTNDTAVSEMRTYPVGADIRKLDVEIAAADVYVKEGDAFAVESNLKTLEISEKDGLLSLKTKGKHSFFGANSDTGATLTVYIPANAEFESISVSTGGGKFTSDALTAQTIELELGAGDVCIASLTASKSAKIEGGVGRIVISGGALNDLDMDMGMGQLNLCAALTGNCVFDMGVGESNVTLIGSKDEYGLDIEKGIGATTVDGASVSDFGSSGKNKIEIHGGIGAINVEFKQPE